MEPTKMKTAIAEAAIRCFRQHGYDDVSVQMICEEAGVNNAMRNPGVNKYRKVWSLIMNPEDAKEFGFADGETIRLSTNRGSIEIPVEYSWRDSAATA